MIHGHDGEGQSHVVAQILGEQGTDGTVDDAGGQNGLLGGLTLALQVTAGDLTGSVHSLVEVHGQGQEVDAVAGLLGSGGAAENGGVAVAAEAGAVGQAGELTGLDDQGTACQGVLIDLVVLKLHSGALDGVHFFFLHVADFVFCDDRCIVDLRSLALTLGSEDSGARVRTKATQIGRIGVRFWGLSRRKTRRGREFSVNETQGSESDQPVKAAVPHSLFVWITF